MDGIDRIVIKIGTGVLTGEDGSFAAARLSRLLDEILPFVSKPHQQAMIVSSGAVGLGRMRLNLKGDLSLAEKQACAAIGQSVLIQNYNVILSRFGLMAGQILINSQDLKNEERRKNLMASLREMERFPVIPVINENDVTSTEELEVLGESDLSFGDNDRLSALLALEIKARLLVILTDSEGIYLDKPKNSSDSPLSYVEDLSVLDQVHVWNNSKLGRGGVKSKIASARLAAEGGTPCWVVSGFKEGQLETFFKTFADRRAPLCGTFVVGKGTVWKKS
jgi:glutamate 5-kinase